MVVVNTGDRDIFEKLLNLACKKLAGDLIASLSPAQYEVAVADAIQAEAEKNKFKLKVELVSGIKFPDIVCHLANENIFGVEVKSTKSDKWECIGNSINESSRIDGVENVYVFFGKLGGEASSRFSRYENVLKEIRITHFPRYFIHMDTPEGEDIFSKMNVEYNNFRVSEEKYRTLKKHYRSTLKDGEEVWWMEDESQGATVTLWNEAEEDKKNNVIAESLLFFTELFNPKSPSKYHRMASWLVVKHGLVSPNLRDNFSAGGKVEISGYSFPQVAKRLMDNIEFTKEKIKQLDRDDIAHYWKIKEEELPKKDETIFNHWLTRVMNNLALGIDKDGISALQKALKSEINK